MLNDIGSFNDFLFQKKVCQHVESNHSSQDMLGGLFSAMQYKMLQ